MTSIQKCGVIGVGFVGATSAFTLSTSGLFSEVVLVDMNRKKAEGEAADINHGISFAKPCFVRAGDYGDLAECGLVVIAAGANQKPGETRIELLGRNRVIMSSIIEHLMAVNQSAVLLIVSNPVDVLTYMAQKMSGLPAGQVIGSGTVLDTARLKYLVGQHLNVDSRNVHAFIIGEHGDSELAVWSSANISGVDLADYCRITGKDDSFGAMQRIYENVRDAAYSIIEGKGATYYGIGMAVRRIAEAIVRDEHSVLPVSSMISGHYGVDGICLGLPAVVGRNGAESVLDIPLSQDELFQLQSSAQKMKELIDELGD
ncbi:L-lactate dehydrogenase [Agathobaculum sp. NSJ-28]|uniref:L-lactate dehydrogenase n=2 Tax=Agathobaculum TaxID=2048137 RepID=A0A923LT86_9FIRM|nr:MULTISPECIES: L-lactate dehydrogenase [Butyricicoccaceae]MBC5724026.1 L-lactate dehydrogenase [Agathobaculum faecis]MCU6787659.1 L-lactate dehydrogenase [Agathobaculum ammoniilyticum]WOC74026.1 L-lactate dehydrogenase [Intestinibacillus sp. NTUH-41-i26]SCI41801.1 L-lactate dehydrogenase [uncultured Butyricicoccus sp.]